MPRGRPRTTQENKKTQKVQETMTEDVIEEPVVDNTEIDDIIDDGTEEKEEAAMHAEKESLEKNYNADDLIKCRSVVQGGLIFKGQKSGTVYRWSAPNDVTEIEYQDLRAARVSKNNFLMKAYFIIEDEDLINMPEWKEVKDIYGKLYSRKDLTEIFRIDDVYAMVREIKALPEGVKAQMANVAKSLMDDGKLDSISKIKAIDETLGTDLMLFIGGGSVVGGSDNE